MTDPILISIATALAGRAATSLYDLVKKKFAGDSKAATALEAAADAPEGSAPVRDLAAELERAEQADSGFREALRAEWDRVSLTQNAQSGGVTNQITGQVTGKVIQARDIHGNVSF